MARLSHTPSPDQEALFGPADLGLTQSDDFSADVQLPPVAVDVSYRAYELGETFAAMNRASRSAGFVTAASTPRRAELTSRYGRGVDAKVEQASENESAHLRAAREHFARASGRNALIGAGYDANEISRDNARDFSAFTSRYGVGVTTAAVRNKAKQRLADNAAAIRKASAKTTQSAS